MRAPMLLAVLVLVGCSREPDAHAAARAWVLENLRDPNSAQFRRVATSTRDPNVVCGEVNAKNALGGYSGFRSFHVRIEPRGATGVLNEGLSDAVSRFHQQLCAEALQRAR